MPRMQHQRSDLLEQRRLVLDERSEHALHHHYQAITATHLGRSSVRP